MQDSAKHTERVFRDFKITQPRTFHELGILVLDGSGSMKGVKNSTQISLAQSVSNAVRNTFTRFKNSAFVNNFSLAVVYYDDSAKIEVDITDSKQLNDMRAYDPTEGMGGATTSIAAGLKEAQKLANKFLAVKTLYDQSVVIVVLSAGLDMMPSETVYFANSLKSNPKIEIYSCFLESIGGDQDLVNETSIFLKGISSHPEYGFIKTSDIDEIQNFILHRTPFFRTRTCKRI